MTILITAGPTREAIDPVRYISNRSSGKMGYSLAKVAAQQGNRVILISGPTSLDVPAGVDFIPVESTQEMYDAVAAQISQADTAIMCAAVADYRPVKQAEVKIKKNAERMTIELERTPDILGSLRQSMGFTGILVGFAAETNDVEDYARGKLERKQCDMVVANDVSRRDIGFDSNSNEVTLVLPDRSIPVNKAPKETIARVILQTIETLRDEKASNADS
jgi:phosphopantothenoylcysteine decarboxylase/phosphopantothenate--cysteine ligase